jgi:membrane-associated phospholipid phosphatase
MKVLAVAIATCFLCAPASAWPDATPDRGKAEQAPQKEEAPVRDDGRRTVARLPANLLRATVGVFGSNNLTPAIIGVASTSVGALFDDRIAEGHTDPANDFGQALDAGGGPIWSTAAVGVLFVAGRFSSRTRFRAVTYDWLDAVAVTAGYTAVLKAAVGRQRPNGADDKSFPSGHSSNAFALAVVAERHFGWKVGVPAYGIAAAVALSRLQGDKHYLSDVMAGATLGYIVGRTVVRVNSQPMVTRSRVQLNLSPVVSRRTRALVLDVAF